MFMIFPCLTSSSTVSLLTCEGEGHHNHDPINVAGPIRVEFSGQYVTYKVTACLYI